jgi:hypothetical protein
MEQPQEEAPEVQEEKEEVAEAKRDPQLNGRSEWPLLSSSYTDLSWSSSPPHCRTRCRQAMTAASMWSAGV